MSGADAVDLARELTKVADVLAIAARHFTAESEMNAALHMAGTVRPAPLAMAVVGARDDLTRLIAELVDPLTTADADDGSETDHTVEETQL